MSTDVLLISPSLLDDVLAINMRAEELATSGEWEAVSHELAKRDALLREVRPEQRETALTASLRSTEQIRALVEKAKHEVGQEIGQLQRGRKATESYSAHS